MNGGGGGNGGDSSGPSMKVVSAAGHNLSCVALHKSPHFDDIYLSVGDWSLQLETIA
eukprot:TRINITY_DN7691_c0_g1_i1.p2 TRINITY_DN7691_c0_g1~~TRINITY_DN7691_c0_g1_i1.p2  ORF type:complete len:57 (-),score=19.15 TRINITY_DN7691_c0_g1_i1:22-192(-)